MYHQGVLRWCSLFILLISLFLTGCESEDQQKDKIRDLDFTLVGETDLPQSLREIIQQKKEEPFKLLYSDGGYMYLAVGYGEQITGGFSIEVKDLYLTETMVVIDTNLIGPMGQAPKRKTYPYIVVKTELIDLPVMYR